MKISLKKRDLSPQLTQALAASLRQNIGHSVWRLLHPSARATYLPERFSTLPRLYYQTDDGRSSFLFRLVASSGSPGEPVLLIPSFGFSSTVFRVGGEHSLAESLAQAGFSVYLFNGAQEGDLDAVLRFELAGALEAIREDGGFDRVHCLGHGLGGALLLAHLFERGAAEVATLSLISAPVLFNETARLLARRLSLCAGPCDLRTSRYARWILPFMGEDDERDRGGRRRTTLRWAVADTPRWQLDALLRWTHGGTLVNRAGDLAYLEGLSEVQAPLWLQGEQSASLLAFYGGPVLHYLGGERLDLHETFHGDRELSRSYLGWLKQRRRRSWSDREQKAVDASMVLG